MPIAGLPRWGLICLLLAGAWAQQPPSAILKVSGDVPNALSLTAGSLEQMPRETVVLKEHDGSEATYEGVLLSEILKKAGAPFGHDLRGKALASYVVAEGSDGYQVIFTLAELDADLANERILVADKRGGQPISAQQGPLRLVVPGDKRPARSVRMLQQVHVVQVRK